MRDTSVTRFGATGSLSITPLSSRKGDTALPYRPHSFMRSWCPEPYPAPSSHLQGDALGKRDQLIHGPLDIGMGPVLHRFDPSGRRDQKVAREAEWASRKPQAKMAMSNPAHGGAQGLAANEPKRRFHAKFFVEGLLRIANQHEWNILLVRPDRLSGGVKDDHLFDARRFDPASAPAHLGNVRVADRAVHEPPELQMDEAVRVGELDRLARDGFQSCSRNNIAWFEFHVHSLLVVRGTCFTAPMACATRCRSLAPRRIDTRCPAN